MTSYAPDVFDQPSLDAARTIILTPEQGLSTEQRWRAETDWIMQRISFASGLLLDIGCGVGRLSERLVSERNPVIGVDISASMRRFAEREIARPEQFTAITPVMLERLVNAGLRAQGAIAVWTLQHVLDLKAMVWLLAEAMEPGATLWTMERNERYVPTREGRTFTWQNDGLSVEAALGDHFTPVSCEEVPATLCQPGAALRRWRR